MYLLPFLPGVGVTTGNMICWHWNLKLPINKNDEAKEEKHLCYELTLNSLPLNTAQISPSAKQGHRLIIIVRTHKYTHLTTLAKPVYVSCVWKKKKVLVSVHISDDHQIHGIKISYRSGFRSGLKAADVLFRSGFFKENSQKQNKKTQPKNEILQSMSRYTLIYL